LFPPETGPELNKTNICTTIGNGKPHLLFIR
jgi:hypothetical protein